MIELLRTDCENPHFKELVRLLDIDLQLTDGDEHAFFAQFNGTDSIKNVVVVYQNGHAIGCGALREYANGVAEIKRMFVREDERGKRIGAKILGELENWAVELSYHRCILETGRNRPEAISFYYNNDYREIDNFGPYQNVAGSICFEKELIASGK